ncbi:MAG TPA: TonB-dependent receptor, partial [Segetibacter sp.]
MIRTYFLLFFFCQLSLSLFSQQIETGDTLKSATVSEVTVRAYGQNRRLAEIAAAVNLIDQQALTRYNNASILNAVNATAGVRMEERSPGSYRLNIRGSSLRSPFGVRNVKIYYNNIPFTDPGGTTYLNQLGFYNISSIEIIKGPGSSLYGAGTGGVTLLQTNTLSRKRGVSVAYTTGSFGANNININVVTGSDTFKSVVNYQHQTSNGYREQSALRRDIVSWDAVARLSESDELTANFLYGDLFYQTPGALTETEYNQNKKSARPTVLNTPGAAAAKAAIYQKMFMGGITYKKSFTENWRNTTTIYGAFTKLDNPAIRNYARTLAPNFGGRLEFEYRKSWGTSAINWQSGIEYQQAYQTVKTYSNKNGNPDVLQSDDEINLYTGFVFTQLSYEINNWILTGGVSINRSKNDFTRLSSVPFTNYSIRFNNEFAPRISVLNKITEHVSAYASYSKGFSPPTIEEIFPTGSLLNPGLAAEKGNNYEAGLKGSVLGNKLTFDISTFYFSLNNAIVQRRDAAGGDYYTNAGSTKQQGLESQLSYRLFQNKANNRASVWLSHTLYDFSYKDFKQVNNDFSGKQLPGAPKHTVAAGFDVQTSYGLYANVTYQYTDAIALNDANSAFAGSYNLLGARVGFKKAIGKIAAEF